MEGKDYATLLQVAEILTALEGLECSKVTDQINKWHTEIVTDVDSLYPDNMDIENLIKDPEFTEAIREAEANGEFNL